MNRHLRAVLPVLILAAMATALPMAGGSMRSSASSIPAAHAAPHARRLSLVAAVQPASGKHAAVTWTVREGQTLSGIAASAYGSPSSWPALWWVNKTAVTDPNLIRAGQVIRLSRWHPVLAWLARLAAKAQGAVRPSSVPVLAASTSDGGGDHDGDTSDASVQPHAAAVHIPAAAGIGPFPASGTYSFTMLEDIWKWAGGPASVAWAAATIAECESGGRTDAYNPSGASGLWQILGAPAYWSGSTDWFNAHVNAIAAVWKYRQAGGSFSPWVCRA